MEDKSRGASRVFSEDQRELLGLLFRQQTADIKEALVPVMIDAVKQCKTDRVCKEVDFKALATKQDIPQGQFATIQDINPEKLLAFKAAPIYWIRVACFILAISAVEKTSPDAVSGVLRFVGGLFGAF
jgi:hypothetical protein